LKEVPAQAWNVTQRIRRMNKKLDSLIGKKAAEKFGNPRLINIAFRSFRHWKGTLEYHRTKDSLYVKKILGNKQIRSTLKYIDLEANIFRSTDDQFFVKVAANVQEVCALIEVGFEYVTGEYHDGGKIFRKRK
jgi:hypothetical protein